MIEVISDSAHLESYYDTIYLSPHLDDVALSCGGQIYRQTKAGQRVLVATIMAGDPGGAPGGESAGPPGGVQLSAFADSLHRRWGLSDLAEVVQARRAEDAAACHILGAAYQHWNVPDCIYRVDGGGELLYRDVEAIFGTIHSAEFDLIERIGRAFDRLPGHGRLVPPLTLGHHVDHQIVRRAAELWFGPGLWYYEDYPYAQGPEAQQELNDYRQKWQFEVIPLDEQALDARARAIAAFGSQVNSFFHDEADLRQQVWAYAGEVGGERLWLTNKD
jgi:LmbE family N-acetylglucosaminyl deacetylase